MLFRKALPCPKCGCTCEEYNLKTKYLGCPRCESQYDRTRTVMYLRDIRIVEDFKSLTHAGMFVVKATLFCGQELMTLGPMESILRQIEENEWVVEGVNYHTEDEATG